VQRTYDAKVAKGYVIGTTPPAGTRLKAGSQVTIIVSEGIETKPVPSVIGKPSAEAQATIKAAGFLVKVVEEYSATVAKGKVISQNPDGGVSIDAGSTVTIVVSKGANLVNVPDVTSMTEADAIAQLEDLGLDPKVVYQISPDVGIVINQDPLPDTKVAKGTKVTIYVGKAP